MIRIGWLCFVVAGASVVTMTASVSAVAQEAAVLTPTRELMRAEAQLNSGAYGDAKETLRAVVEKEPDNGAAWLMLGRAQTFLEQYGNARQSFDKAEEAGVDASTARGAVYYRTGAFAKARQSLTKAIETDSQDADAFYLLGLVHFKEKNFSEARASLMTARELDEELAPESLLFSGIAAAQLNDPKTAEEELNQVMRLAPGTDVAGAAKRALDGLKGGKAYIAVVSLMNQFDSNVLLVPVDGGFFAPEEITERDGSRAVFTGKVGWTPSFGNFSAEASYGLYQSFHWTNRATLDRLDVSNHAFVLGGSYRTGAHLIQIPYAMSVAVLDTFNDATKFSLVNRVSPGYAYTTGPHTLGLQDELGYENFAADNVALTVDGEEIEQTRDNLFNRFTGFYRYAFAKGRGHLTPSVTLATADATGDNSWDQSGMTLGFQSGLPIGEAFTCNAGFSWGARTYPNLFPDLKADNGVDFADRNDRIGKINTSFAYSADGWGAFAGLNYIRNLSTIDDFDYVRTIYSLGVNASF